jgi:hypothetical protein
MTAPATSAASSGTIISEGVKWGHQVLSPDYPFDQGGSPNQFRKVMILLTDGGNDDGPANCSGATAANPQANAYMGMGVTDCHCDPGGCLDQAVRTQADLAKAEGIEIFVIRYCRGGCNDYSDQQLLKYVASSTPGTDDHYFEAPSTSQIDTMFQKIGQQLGFRLL